MLVASGYGDRRLTCAQCGQVAETLVNLRVTMSSGTARAQTRQICCEARMLPSPLDLIGIRAVLFRRCIWHRPNLPLTLLISWVYSLSLAEIHWIAWSIIQARNLTFGQNIHNHPLCVKPFCSRLRLVGSGAGDYFLTLLGYLR